MPKWTAMAPAAAAGLFVAATTAFAIASPGYSQRLHPVALLGAQGEPHALAFNLLGFVLPGLLLAGQAIMLRSAHRNAGWPLRIGLQLVLLSALAFLAMGLLPLDPTNLLAPASRKHALAWTLWCLAFVPGALLLAWGRPSRRGLAIAVAMLVPLCAWFGVAILPAAVAQRIAYLSWFGWWWLIRAPVPVPERYSSPAQ